MNSYGSGAQPLNNAGAAGNYNQQATQTPANPQGDLPGASGGSGGFKCNCPLCQAQGASQPGQAQQAPFQFGQTPAVPQQPTAQTVAGAVPPPTTPGLPQGDTFGGNLSSGVIAQPVAGPVVPGATGAGFGNQLAWQDGTPQLALSSGAIRVY